MVRLRADIPSSERPAQSSPCAFLGAGLKTAGCPGSANGLAHFHRFSLTLRGIVGCLVLAASRGRGHGSRAEAAVDDDPCLACGRVGLVAFSMTRADAAPPPGTSCADAFYQCQFRCTL